MTQKVTQKKIDEVANLWNKTKDEQYKNEWYKLIREFTYGKNINNINTII